MRNPAAPFATLTYLAVRQYRNTYVPERPKTRRDDRNINSAEISSSPIRAKIKGTLEEYLPAAFLLLLVVASYGISSRLTIIIGMNIMNLTNP